MNKENNNNILKTTKDKVEWITKRVPLDDMQEEYVTFMLNEQERFITLLSAHIYAASGSLNIGENKELEFFLSEGRKAIEEREGK